MIRLGIDGNGSSLTNGITIAGINKSTTGNADIYHNSIYIGGTGVTGSAGTYAFRRTASGTDDVRNNILVNARSNSGGSGKHYTVGINATTNFTSQLQCFL
jgi:hypothetical protein